jgi:hypothetical protein
VNVQRAERPAASDAVHETVVDPTANVAPDDGVQVVVSGAWPPVTVGAENVTDAPVAPAAAAADALAGHVTARVGVGVGVMGVLLPQEDNASAATPADDAIELSRRARRTRGL